MKYCIVLQWWLTCWSLDLQELSFFYTLSALEFYIDMGPSRPFVIREAWLISSLSEFQTFPKCSLFIRNISLFQSHRGEVPTSGAAAFSSRRCLCLSSPTVALLTQAWILSHHYFSSSLSHFAIFHFQQRMTWRWNPGHCWFLWVELYGNVAIHIYLCILSGCSYITEQSRVVVEDTKAYKP